MEMKPLVLSRQLTSHATRWSLIKITAEKSHSRAISVQSQSQQASQDNQAIQSKHKPYVKGSFDQTYAGLSERLQRRELRKVDRDLVYRSRRAQELKNYPVETAQSKISEPKHWPGIPGASQLKSLIRQTTKPEDLKKTQEIIFKYINQYPESLKPETLTTFLRSSARSGALIDGLQFIKRKAFEKLITSDVSQEAFRLYAVREYLRNKPEGEIKQNAAAKLNRYTRLIHAYESWNEYAEKARPAFWERLDSQCAVIYGLEPLYRISRSVNDPKPQQAIQDLLTKHLARLADLIQQHPVYDSSKDKAEDFYGLRYLHLDLTLAQRALKSLEELQFPGKINVNNQKLNNIIESIESLFKAQGSNKLDKRYLTLVKSGLELEQTGEVEKDPISS